MRAFLNFQILNVGPLEKALKPSGTSISYSLSLRVGTDHLAKHLQEGSITKLKAPYGTT